MEDLFKTDSCSIRCFKPKQVITRIEPSERTEMVYNDNLMVSTEVKTSGDRSFMGDPMEYIGIFNGQIYLKHLGRTGRVLYSESPIRLSLDQWANGWAEFVLPEGLTYELI